MGFLGSLFSSSSSSHTSQATTNNDNRRVNTSSGSGLTAMDGSTLNFSMTDPGSIQMAGQLANSSLSVTGQAVSSSLDLAKQIATTLGASVGQFSTGATGSVDAMTHLLDNQQQGVQAMGTQNQTVTLVALGVAAVVAMLALRRGK